MKIRVTLIEEMLGTACADPAVHRTYIASKSADAEKVEQELESLPADELFEKARTVFHRTPDGRPCIWDYQFKGFLKEAIGVMVELGEKAEVGKLKLTKWTYKRAVDNFVFVGPRTIVLGALGPECTRPLRADTMRGERVALATSETVPAGTEFEVEVTTLSPALDALVRQALDYGRLKGLGQWRNSGKGRFTWKEIG